MKRNWKKLLAWAILLILILSLVVWAQTTNLTNLDLSGTLAVTGASTLTGAVTASTAPITCGSYSIHKTMTFFLDSVGYDNVHAVFTLARGITVLRTDLYLGSAIGTNACTVLFNSSGDSCAIACTTAADGEGYSYTTTTAFDAAQVCTVQTIDGSDGDGGIDSYLIIQYTDY